MIVQGGRWKVEGGEKNVRGRYAPAIPLPPSALPLTQRAFTLVELLVTIVIIAILAAALLGASSAAFESARRSRTKSIITKIDGLLMEKYQSFTTRRVNVNPAIETYIRSAFPAGDRGKAMADMRLLALRELMAMEMPDRWSDILATGIPASSPMSVTPRSPLFLADVPALTKTYQRRYYATGSTDDETLVQNQGAECLYLTIMLACGDGEAADLFSEQDIADTDGDGALEFIDGWGRPIQFIRWPAGYALRSNIMTAEADADHDPFDPFRRDLPTALPSSGAYQAPFEDYVERLRDDSRPFRLVPLIYSAGADGITDINASPGLVTTVEGRVDPYGIDTNTGDYEFGVPGDPTFANGGDGDDNSIDNITNHSLEQ